MNPRDDASDPCLTSASVDPRRAELARLALELLRFPSGEGVELRRLLLAELEHDESGTGTERLEALRWVRGATA